MNCFPKYFKNLEPPIICYKHNKPARGILFNHNKMVSDLNILNNYNAPEIWDCASSKFCYAPAGHIITGNFDMIKDKRIRALLSKGPKKRLPSLINFDTCRNYISETLNDYSSKWCCREHAELDALLQWKKYIMDIIKTRIAFFTSINHFFTT